MALQTLSSQNSKDLIKLAYRGNLTHMSKSPLPKKLDNLHLEISGMPKSYKTTLILSNVANLSIHRVSSWFVQERASEINKRKDPLLYSISLADLATKTLLTKKSHRVTFLDRGIYDQLAFLTTFYKLGIINKRKLTIASNFLVELYGDKSHSIIICYCTPQTSLKREGLRRKRGYVMNDLFLSALSDSYKNLPETITKLRNEAGLGNIPLPIVELNSNWSWKEYSSLFGKTVGSYHKLFTH